MPIRTDILYNAKSIIVSDVAQTSVSVIKLGRGKIYRLVNSSGDAQWFQIDGSDPVVNTPPARYLGPEAWVLVLGTGDELRVISTTAAVDAHTVELLTVAEFV